MAKSVLMVVSAADRWTLYDGEIHPSGFWAEEVAVPHEIFSGAGFGITIATPGGKAPTLDRLSLSLAGGSAPWKVKGIEKYLASIQGQLDHPRSLSDVNADD
ncbi:MAG: type 1 glutamine amidotransferase domain-containing protein, partial [Solirubrobacterales bacterium]